MADAARDKIKTIVEEASSKVGVQDAVNYYNAGGCPHWYDWLDKQVAPAGLKIFLKDIVMDEDYPIYDDCGDAHLAWMDDVVAKENAAGEDTTLEDVQNNTPENQYGDVNASDAYIILVLTELLKDPRLNRPAMLHRLSKE